MRVSLLIPGVLALVLATGCGSGGNVEPSAADTDTPRSERAYRQASIMQQEASVPQPAAAPPERGSEEPEGVSESGTIDFGHRFGLPFARNVVGDPEAPVLIVEYSDYQ